MNSLHWKRLLIGQPSVGSAKTEKLCLEGTRRQNGNTLLISCFHRVRGKVPVLHLLRRKKRKKTKLEQSRRSQMKMLDNTLITDCISSAGLVVFCNQKGQSVAQPTVGLVCTINGFFREQFATFLSKLVIHLKVGIVDGGKYRLALVVLFYAYHQQDNSCSLTLRLVK